MTLIDGDWHRLPALRRDVLVALAVGGPDSGAAIHDRVRDDDRQTKGSTHRHLQELQDAGYVTRERVPNTRGPTYEYHLTDDGRDLLWRGMVIPGQEIEGEV